VSLDKCSLTRTRIGVPEGKLDETEARCCALTNELDSRMTSRASAAFDRRFVFVMGQLPCPGGNQFQETALVNRIYPFVRAEGNWGVVAIRAWQLVMATSN